MVNKIKVRFGREEWYPVYEETEDEYYSTVIELTQYELFKVRRVLQEFNHVQNMIESKIYEGEKQ